jgi:hypothetical protein
LVEILKTALWGRDAQARAPPGHAQSPMPHEFGYVPERSAAGAAWNCARTISRLPGGNDLVHFARNYFVEVIRYSSPPKKEKKKMKDRRNRIRSRGETKAFYKNMHKRLDLVDKDMDLKLETLSCIFSGTEDHPEEFHQLYVQPLLDAGLTLEVSLAMLVEGVLFPN